MREAGSRPRPDQLATQSPHTLYRRSSGEVQAVFFVPRVAARAAAGRPSPAFSSLVLCLSISPRTVASSSRRYRILDRRSPFGDILSLGRKDHKQSSVPPACGAQALCRSRPKRLLLFFLFVFVLVVPLFLFLFFVVVVTTVISRRQRENVGVRDFEKMPAGYRAWDYTSLAI